MERLIERIASLERSLEKLHNDKQTGTSEERSDLTPTLDAERGTIGGSSDGLLDINDIDGGMRSINSQNNVWEGGEYEPSGGTSGGVGSGDWKHVGGVVRSDAGNRHSGSSNKDGSSNSDEVANRLLKRWGAAENEANAAVTAAPISAPPSAPPSYRGSATNDAANSMDLLAMDDSDSDLDSAPSPVNNKKKKKKKKGMGKKKGNLQRGQPVYGSLDSDSAAGTAQIFSSSSSYSSSKQKKSPAIPIHPNHRGKASSASSIPQNQSISLASSSDSVEFRAFSPEVVEGLRRRKVRRDEKMKTAHCDNDFPCVTKHAI